MYTGEMVAVSEQQLIDCDHAKPFEDLGCEGGDFTGAASVNSPMATGMIVCCIAGPYSQLPGLDNAEPLR